MLRTKSPIRTKAVIQATLGPSADAYCALKDQCVSLVRQVTAAITVRFEAQPQPLGMDLVRRALMMTDRCVFSSSRDARLLGDNCVLLPEACGTPSPADGTRAVDFMVKQLYCFVATASLLLPALAELTPTRCMRKQRGMPVFTTTNLKDAK